jgi:Flp pilus assembly protein TadG
MDKGMFKRMFTRERRKGNVLVETAFVAIVFFALVFGILDVGQFLYVHHALVQRARYAIRWGAINDPDSTDVIKNKILYNQSTAKTNPNGTAATGYFGLTASNVTVTTSGKDTDNYRVNVTITHVPFRMMSVYKSGSFNGGSVNVSVPLGLFN